MKSQNLRCVVMNSSSRKKSAGALIILLLFGITLAIAAGSVGPSPTGTHQGIQLPDTTYGSSPATDSLYQKLLTTITDLYNQQRYEECLAALKKANSLKPDVQSIQERIIRVEGLLAQQKKTQAEYNRMIALADSYFTRKDYLNAKASYQMALDLRPNHAYARDQMGRTLEMLRSQKAQNILYDVAVASADKLFQAGEYEKARTEYENAARILPDQAYPKEKINAILKIQVDRQVKEELYRTAIASADRYFASRNHQRALLEYQKAQQQKPEEPYPRERIAELQKILAELAALEAAYKEMISGADRLFVEVRYPDARSTYEEALVLKPHENYPRERIREIDGILAQVAKTNADYERFIMLADSFYIDKNFIRARQHYLLALQVKPGEGYPKAMLAKTEASVGEQLANEQAVQEAYEAAITNADQLFFKGAYAEAREEYSTAQAIKPGESYPRQKISEIDTRYKTVITEAHKLFAAKAYEPAKAEYLRAGEIKPAESLPKERIRMIDSILQAELLRKEILEEEYHTLVRTADSLLAGQQYESARESYRSASAIKPTESYLREKIREIDLILAEILERKRMFDKLVTTADQYLAFSEYTRARDSYQQAAELLPEEDYPRRQLRLVTDKIDSIYRANRAEYDKAVGEGDGFFNSYEYDRAIDAYMRASMFLPMEEYPRERIAKIRHTIAENAIADVLGTPVTIRAGEEQKFSFDPVSIASRRNNFIYLKVKNLSTGNLNILLRYGRANQIHGGLAIRNIPPGEEVTERLISVKDQDPWYREDNNWISLHAQGGDIEVSFIQVSRAFK